MKLITRYLAKHWEDKVIRSLDRLQNKQNPN